MPKKTNGSSIVKTLGRLYVNNEGQYLFCLSGGRNRDAAQDMPLQPLLDILVQNPDMDAHDVLGKVGRRGLRPADIETARLFLHRYGSNSLSPEALPVESHRVLLLDECTPVTAAVPLSRVFGWTTHVEAEGLAGKRTPDMTIWDYVSRHNFAAIVTRDSDFFKISDDHDTGQRERLPFLIHIGENLNAETLTALFIKHGHGIRHLMTSVRNGVIVRGCRMSSKDGLNPLI
ncbi:MAG: DUF5615 family PIN-like protein [Pseudobdellovibrionaceae bacterium]|jgi:predicted nuclease of predicted toxin-antitoxin system|nr:DUF5615 family PIN-like protein [Pseudobdellovibrionaceae bacterium]